MTDLVIQACIDELEKIARKIDVPQALRGLVRPSHGPESFQHLLDAYRTGMKGIDSRSGNFVRDKGYLTHDTRSFGDLAAMEDALRHGRIRGSMNERAQFSQPGVREVYWHRGFPGIEQDESGRVTRMWFRGQGAEGFHVDQGRLAREGAIKPDAVHRLTGTRAPHIARTGGPHDLKPGDLAVLSAAERKNLPELLGQVKDRGLKWSDSAMQQEALRQMQLENALTQRGKLKGGKKITDLDEDEYEYMLEEFLEGRKKGSLPRPLRWWRSAEAPTTANLERKFMERIRKPYE